MKLFADRSAREAAPALAATWLAFVLATALALLAGAAVGAALLATLVLLARYAILTHLAGDLVVQGLGPRLVG